MNKEYFPLTPIHFRDLAFYDLTYTFMSCSLVASEDAKIPEHEKNTGVEERNARDLAQTEEERDKSEMVSSVLEVGRKLFF